MEMDQLTLAEAPTITLGKRAWPVPELAARQIMRIIPKMMQAQKADIANIGEDDIGLFYDIVYVALTRAHPELTRDAFDDLPIGFDELLAALAVIAKQAGMVAEVATGAAGEAKPPTVQPSTGAPS